MKEIGLYIHIPFCQQKCLYCDFNSYVCKDAEIDSYMDALIKEIRMYQSEHRLKYKTVFIGGGTPTFIHYKHIAAVMKEIQPMLCSGAEVSMECNPGTVNKQSLQAYFEMGINRLSIGLQAWQEDLQKQLGRIHDTRQFLDNIEQAYAAGFTNINADLMFGLPGQSLEMWLETVENVAKLGIKHVSCYSLKVEEGTPFYRLYEENKLQLPLEDVDRQMYHSAIELLQGYGLEQYEISNFAVKDFECKHNLIYWNNEEYIGVGAGSHSKLGNMRFNNYSSLQEYMKLVCSNVYPIEERNVIEKAEEMWETIILSLRLNRGLNITSFDKRYETQFCLKYAAAIEKLSKQGLIEIQDNTIKLTSLGKDLSNTVFIEFLE